MLVSLLAMGGLPEPYLSLAPLVSEPKTGNVWDVIVLLQERI